jgi:ubiquinone/menaquinone biosynthesis C-methylase UbiE
MPPDNASAGKGLVADYAALDSSDQSSALITRLEDNEDHPMWFAARLRSHQLLGAKAEDYVLDVGCGPGRAVAELRSQGVHAVGVDISQRVIDRARERFPEAEFHVGPAEKLSFPNGVFNSYRAERLYRHLSDPAPALAEAYRVLAPGGRIVLMDLVPELGLIDADDVVMTHNWAQAYADALGNRWFCHQAGSLLVDSGFVQVDAELYASMQTSYVSQGEAIPRAALAAGVATSDQVSAWVAEQRRRSEVGRYFQMRPFVLWSARKSPA